MDMVELNARKAKEINTLQRDNRIEEPTRLKQDVIERLERPAPLLAPMDKPSTLP
jgi:general secretion pathway protein D